MTQSCSINKRASMFFFCVLAFDLADSLVLFCLFIILDFFAEYGTYSEEKCNLFHGEWVADQVEPLYTNRSCSFIEDDQNCMKNGRPDTDYLYWRWNPQGCELARLDPWRFLELMRNKSWAFIGDSITRNHVQSFLCVLSKVGFK